MYRENEYTKCINHQGNKWIFWHGIDCSPFYESRVEKVNAILNTTITKNLYVSDSAYDNLSNFGATIQHIEHYVYNKEVFTKDVDMNSNSIINLGDPVNSSDAVNKAYIDSKVTTLNSSIITAKSDSNTYTDLAIETFGNYNLTNKSIIKKKYGIVDANEEINHLRTWDVVNRSYTLQHPLTIGSTYIYIVRINHIPFDITVTDTSNNVISHTLFSPYEIVFQSNAHVIIHSPVSEFRAHILEIG